ncbi:MAG: TAT-variant-translocated molybdopterin oxidoreductase [Opitutales bacterium]
MSDSEPTGPQYWKSLDDLAETPGFRDWVEREFPAGASELDGVNRRQFMKVMAASFGLAGLGTAGCRRPEQRILPYAEQPENTIPGVPSYFSTSMPGHRDNIPVIVEAHQARPTKIEGNPSYEPYGGSTGVYTQASILDLYDPDRATKSRKGSNTLAPAKVRDRLAQLRVRHMQDKGAGLVVLAEPATSPSRAALIEELRKKFPQATVAEYAAVDKSTPEAASESVFGERLRPAPNFKKAKRILSLDADFLQDTDGGLAQARDFASNRKVKSAEDASAMSRLYAVESALTMVGSMADHRLRMNARRMGALLAQIGEVILLEKGGSESLRRKLEEAGESLAVDPDWVKACAADLLEHSGESLIVAGEHLPESVHALVFALNEALGGVGETVNYLQVPAALPDIHAAAQRLEQGGVATLLILGGNPVYNAPADLDWQSLQARAEESIHLSYSYNETSAEADIMIARSHFLESWGDGRTFDGTLVPVQPMIEPLFDTFNELEALARFIGVTENDPYAIVRATFEKESEGGEDNFERFLASGLLEGSGYPVRRAKADMEQVAARLDEEALNAVQLDAEHLEVRFMPSHHAYDGRYANNGWMMECPDPITKLTWDNAILISPRLAKELEDAQGIAIFPEEIAMNRKGGFFEAAKGNIQRNKAQFKRGKEEAIVAELSLNGRTVTAPIHVVPGMADYTVVLPLGMGRTEVGRVGSGVGFDAYPVRESDGLGYQAGGALRLTEATHRLANTQEHWSMEGRAIVREGTAEQFIKDPQFANHMGVESHAPANYGPYKDEPLQKIVTEQYRGNSAYDHPQFDAPPPNVDAWKGKEDAFPRIQQWGMAIDLNSCTGCSACVVACQSENNTPIVGKEQVLRGREMHWMRLDRYFSAPETDPSGIPEDVQVSFMSMLCQHCENAPCESVCPVNATLHDRQGLNVMAYNRCVGTRYCANNCPYKVRRFNFFDWNKRKIGEFYKGPLGEVDEPELGKMQKNPNVSIRMRGVMEKCTFCVQRIESAKIEQKREASDSDNVHVPDGRIKTACQQVCPTEAITFGDLSDPDTEVSRMKANDRNYSVLGYLNVRPRTTYLARVRNPNADMPESYARPYAYKAYKERYGSGSGNGHGDESAAAHSGDGEHDTGHGDATKRHEADAAH